jgi:hypothetical protein
MRLTRAQITRMADAVQSSGNGEVFELNTDERGGIRLYAVEQVEKLKPIALGTGLGKTTGGGT